MSHNLPIDLADADDEQIRAYLQAGGSALALLQAGRARIVSGPVPARPVDPDAVAMHVKSLRVPVGLYQRAEAVAHPQGFSGVVRDALTEWLDRHTGTKAEADDAAQALATLQRVLHQHGLAA